MKSMTMVWCIVVPEWDAASRTRDEIDQNDNSHIAVAKVAAETDVELIPPLLAFDMWDKKQCYSPS